MSNIIKYVNQASTPSIASAATALAANTVGNRQGWGIQNLGTTILYVLMGTGASSTVFHFALKAGTGNDDGSGGILISDTGSVFQGIVTIASSGTARYTAWEFT